MTAKPDHSAKTVGDLHAESYADWLKRQCVRWGLPWREEYATPVGERPAVARKGAAA